MTSLWHGLCGSPLGNADMRDSFKGAELLSPEENLLGRVLIKNGLVSRAQVEGCARDVIGGPAASLEDALVKRGVMRPSTVQAVKHAVEKKLRERGISAQAFAPSGASGVLDPVMPEQLRKTPTQLNGQEQRMKDLGRRIVRSRFHRQLLEHVLADQMGPLFVKTLASRLGTDPRRVMRVLIEWKSRGVVKNEAAHRFVFAPTREQLGDMHELMRLWTHGRTHSKILGWILKEEFD